MIGKRLATEGSGRKWVVLTTPYSGWFHSAAERGPGIAIFLRLADWLYRHDRRHNLLIAATSGHEFENSGARLLLSEMAPRPEDTKLWLHLGAGLAAWDHHATENGLKQAGRPDGFRRIMASPDFAKLGQPHFSGQDGFDPVLIAGSEEAHGELREVLGAGYSSVIGGFGGHQYHHTPQDHPHMTDESLLQPVADAFERTLRDGLLEKVPA